MSKIEDLKTYITGIEYGEEYIIINWVNSYYGFGQILCDSNWKVLDDENMGNDFAEFVISKAKKRNWDY